MKLIAMTGYKKVALLGTGDFFAKSIYFLSSDEFVFRRDCCGNMEDSESWEAKCGEKVNYFSLKITHIFYVLGRNLQCVRRRWCLLLAAPMSSGTETFNKFLIKVQQETSKEGKEDGGGGNDYGMMPGRYNMDEDETEEEEEQEEETQDEEEKEDEDKEEEQEEDMEEETENKEDGEDKAATKDKEEKEKDDKDENSPDGENAEDNEAEQGGGVQEENNNEDEEEIDEEKEVEAEQNEDEENIDEEKEVEEEQNEDEENIDEEKEVEEEKKESEEKIDEEKEVEEEQNEDEEEIDEEKEVEEEQNEEAKDENLDDKDDKGVKGEDGEIGQTDGDNGTGAEEQAQQTNNDKDEEGNKSSADINESTEGDGDENEDKTEEAKEGEDDQIDEDQIQSDNGKDEEEADDEEESQSEEGSNPDLLSGGEKVSVDKLKGEEKGVQFRYCFNEFDTCDNTYALARCAQISKENQCKEMKTACKFKYFKESPSKCCLRYNCLESTSPEMQEIMDGGDDNKIQESQEKNEAEEEPGQQKTGNYSTRFASKQKLDINNDPDAIAHGCIGDIVDKKKCQHSALHKCKDHKNQVCFKT